MPGAGGEPALASVRQMAFAQRGEFRLSVQSPAKLIDRPQGLWRKLPVFWQNAERRPEFPRFYKQIIALRRSHAALSQGETRWLRNSDEARVVTYLRRAGNEEFLVTVNLSNRPFSGTVEVANGPAFADVTPSLKEKSEQNMKSRAVALPSLFLDSWGLRIFSRAAR